MNKSLQLDIMERGETYCLDSKKLRCIFGLQNGFGVRGVTTPEHRDTALKYFWAKWLWEWSDSYSPTWTQTTSLSREQVAIDDDRLRQFTARYLICPPHPLAFGPLMRA